MLHLTLAADDGAAPASLFAFSIWNGARLLAAHLQQHPALVEGKTTIEFGAAGALPSCAALALGARFSLLTDFPAPPLLHAMARTLADPRNAQALGFGVGIGPDPGGGRRRRAAVMGHLWGADATPLLAALPFPPQKAVEAGYDLALVGECLWLHREHANLLVSIYRCLRPGGQVRDGWMGPLITRDQEEDGGSKRQNNSASQHTHHPPRRSSPSPTTCRAARRWTCGFSSWPRRGACTMMKRKGGLRWPS